MGDGWVPPSGTVDPGESLLHALRRELREETTLEVNVERLIGIYSDPAHQIVSDPDGRETHLVTSLVSLSPAREWRRRSFISRLEREPTFVDAPWNGPYYRRFGWCELPATELRPELAAMRRHEASLGLDAWPRTAMIKQL